MKDRLPNINKFLIKATVLLLTLTSIFLNSRPLVSRNNEQISGYNEKEAEPRVKNIVIGFPAGFDTQEFVRSSLQAYSTNDTYFSSQELTAQVALSNPETLVSKAVWFIKDQLPKSTVNNSGTTIIPMGAASDQFFVYKEFTKGQEGKLLRTDNIFAASWDAGLATRISRELNRNDENSTIPGFNAAVLVNIPLGTMMYHINPATFADRGYIADDFAYGLNSDALKGEIDPRLSLDRTSYGLILELDDFENMLISEGNYLSGLIKNGDILGNLNIDLPLDPETKKIYVAIYALGTDKELSVENLYSPMNSLVNTEIPNVYRVVSSNDSSNFVIATSRNAERQLLESLRRTKDDVMVYNPDNFYGLYDRRNEYYAKGNLHALADIANKNPNAIFVIPTVGRADATIDIDSNIKWPGNIVMVGFGASEEDMTICDIKFYPSERLNGMGITDSYTAAQLVHAELLKRMDENPGQPIDSYLRIPFSLN